MEVLAKRLKWLREKDRYSQKEIANKIGMTPSGYQKIEYGDRDPKLDVLVELCKIFQVSADFLLGINNNTKRLKELAEEIGVYEVQIRNLQNEHTELTMRQHELQEIISHLKVKIVELENAQQEKEMARDDKARDSLKMREHALFSTLDRKIVVEAEMHIFKKERNAALNRYIIELLELPASKPSEDPVIKEYLPIQIEIQPDIFDRFALHIEGKGAGFIGHYGDYESIEETLKVKERLLKLFNGK